MMRRSQKSNRASTFKAQTIQVAQEESITQDGVYVHLYGNIEFSHEIPHIKEHGGEGVGLYRTEFQYLTSSSTPTEDELYSEYVKAIELSAGKKLTLRTLVH